MCDFHWRGRGFLTLATPHLCNRSTHTMRIIHVLQRIKGLLASINASAWSSPKAAGGTFKHLLKLECRVYTSRSRNTRLTGGNHYVRICNPYMPIT